jgi:hypothetical protein
VGVGRHQGLHSGLIQRTGDKALVGLPVQRSNRFKPLRAVTLTDRPALDIPAARLRIPTQKESCQTLNVRQGWDM